MNGGKIRFTKHRITILRGIIIGILLIAPSISVAVNPNLMDYVSNECLKYVFTFDEPNIQTYQTEDSKYTSLQMNGCILIGKQTGDPMLPVKSIKLLLPPMTTITSVTITGKSVELGNIEHPINPYQNPVPIGFKSEEFAINSALYASNSLYPSSVYDEYHIGYSHGYSIFDITLYPIQYIPNMGRIFFFPTLTVTINVEKNRNSNQFFRDNLEDKGWVEQLVCNPEVAKSYSNTSTSDYSHGLCDTSKSYDYVIITTKQNNLDYWEINNSIPYNWQSLIEKHKQDDGLECTLMTIQDINACPDYYNSDPLFNDTEAHIREFCKDAYLDWGTKYIFIGGDAEWIPARLMDYTYEKNIDSDIYWSNLDNNFNADHDDDWGEEGDAGFDCYSELFIGRISCDIPQDVSNWMTKSFYYADSDDIDYLDNAVFYGGDTGWSCEGDDFIDYSAIKGTSNWLGPIPGAHGQYPSWLGFNYGFETWNINNIDIKYNLSVKWTAEPPNSGWQGGSESIAIEGLRNAINANQVTLLNGMAHANPTMSLDVNSNDWENLYHNTKPFFIYDYGCHCGDIDAAYDGVLHSMLFHSDTELAFVCVYNTCYGWGSEWDTNSSSALQQKLFWDYLFNTVNNSGSPMNWELGKAMAYSKDTMAPTINWTYSGAPGGWRAIIQGCLLFGDPAQQMRVPIIPTKTPECPTGPTEGVVGTEYTFSTKTTDPEGDHIYYNWNWGDGDYSGWLGPYNSGDTVQALHSWMKNGTYAIKVQAKDIYNHKSDWSAPKNIHITNNINLGIGNISGGFFKVHAVIKNTGDVPAIGINWSINLNGGFILLGKETSGRMMSIPVGGEETISSRLIFGFGKTIILVNISTPIGTISKEQSAMLILFFSAIK